VVTTDFFPPVVDDPRDFGRVAAANALSDVYAMGGRPLLALNLVCFPSKVLPASVLEEILAGARETCALAECLVAGGHSVDDEAIKFGLAVVGEVHPDHLWTMDGMKAGDLLVLTKPLGSGVVTTALRRGVATPEQVAEVTEVMARLNGPAAAAAGPLGIGGATDVTGFGLLGHLKHLVDASEVGATVDVSALPLLEGAREHAAQGVTTGGARRNQAYVEDQLTIDGAVPPELLELCLDPQTSGGLLLACPADRWEELRAALEDAGCPGSVVGRAGDVPAGTIHVVAT
jgi:selenide,water dikinase